MDIASLNSKRATGLSFAASELRYWVPLSASAFVLYGTCAAGEAYVVFGSSLGDYIRPKLSTEGVSMALKLRSYKAVAAQHAFDVPPSLVMPSRGQLSQLRVLRTFKVLVGVGAAAIVSINIVAAYRQGVQTFEQRVLEGGMLNIDMGIKSPYMIREKVGIKKQTTGGNTAKPSLVMRYGGIRDVTAMLQSPGGGSGENHVALPVLMRRRENKHGGNQRVLQAAVRGASKGLNEGCYVHQDLVCSLPSIPQGDGSRIIVQAGGFTRAGAVKRSNSGVAEANDRATKQLLEKTGAEVHMVLLRDGDGDGGSRTAEAVQSREATKDEYGLVTIDAHLAVVCEIIQWVDRHKVSRRKQTDKRGLLATSAPVSAKGENKRRRKSHEQAEGNKPEVVRSRGEEGKQEQIEPLFDDEWILVERVGSHARVLLVSSWQLVTRWWVRLDEAARAGSASAITLATETWPQKIFARIESGTHAVSHSLSFLSTSVRTWATSLGTTLASLFLSGAETHQVRRAVILDLGSSPAILQRRALLPWLPAFLSGGDRTREDPFGLSLLQGLRRASVAVTLWSGHASEAPEIAKGSTATSLVLIYHPGSRGHITARAAAAEFSKKGYECCIVEDSNSGWGELRYEPPPGRRTTVIDVQKTTQRLWAHTTAQLAEGYSPMEVAVGMRRDFENAR